MSYWVYIITNKKNGTLYIGVTNDLVRRLGEHRDGSGSEFADKYGLARLVYCEEYPTAIEAITREKQLKNWKRQWKIDLIEGANPSWDDLSSHLP